MRQTPWIVSVAGATLVLTSCSESTPSFDEVWQDARELMSQTESVTVSTNGTVIAFDDDNLQTTFSGRVDDSQYAITLESETAQSEIRVVDGTMYQQGNHGFYEASGAESLAEQIGDKWLAHEEEPPYKFSTFFEGLTASFETLSETDLENISAQTTQLNDEDVLKYSGEEADGSQSNLYFSMDHQLLKWETDNGNNPVEVTFSDWNNAAEVVAPAGNEVEEVPSK